MAGAAVELSRRKRKKRSVWVKPWILERPVHGAYSSLVSELINADAASFRNYTRMDVASVHYYFAESYFAESSFAKSYFADLPFERSSISSMPSAWGSAAPVAYLRGRSGDRPSE
jgi:hypothetical protein